MICPGCNRQLKFAPRNRSSISEKQEHLWGICPHCKEAIHFVYTQELNQLYGWLEKQESPYAHSLLPLIDRKNILYIPEFENPDSLLSYCRNFSIKHQWNSGFVISEKYRSKAIILSAVHKVTIFPETLFPEIPSFLAEKIIMENLPGKLFCSCKTLSDRFEDWDD